MTKITQLTNALAALENNINKLSDSENSGFFRNTFARWSAENVTKMINQLNPNALSTSEKLVVQGIYSRIKQKHSDIQQNYGYLRGASRESRTQEAISRALGSLEINNIVELPNSSSDDSISFAALLKSTEKKKREALSIFTCPFEQLVLSKVTGSGPKTYLHYTLPISRDDNRRMQKMDDHG